MFASGHSLTIPSVHTSSLTRTTTDSSQLQNKPSYLAAAKRKFRVTQKSLDVMYGVQLLREQLPLWHFVTQKVYDVVDQFQT